MVISPDDVKGSEDVLLVLLQLPFRLLLVLLERGEDGLLVELAPSSFMWKMISVPTKMSAMSFLPRDSIKVSRTLPAVSLHVRPGHCRTQASFARSEFRLVSEL